MGIFAKLDFFERGRDVRGHLAERVRKRRANVDRLPVAIEHEGTMVLFNMSHIKIYTPSLRVAR